MSTSSERIQLDRIDAAIIAATWHVDDCGGSSDDEVLLWLRLDRFSKGGPA